MIVLMNLFYRPLYFLLKCLLLLVRPALSPKMKAWVALRSLRLPYSSQGKKVILFHASSGEIEYVKSVIRDLKMLRPDFEIVVSYSSPSAVKLFENIKSAVDHFFPVPWDQPKAMASFIDQLRPEAVLFARTDLWPEYIYQLQKRQIKTYVISFNPTFGFLSRIWNKQLLNKMTALFCVHPQQSAFLRSFLKGPLEISAPGDTRFDQVFWRLQQPSRVHFSLPERFGVLGSTWAEDEVQIVPILQKIKDYGYKLIWAPHELEHLEEIQKSLESLNLKSQFFSKLNNKSESFSADTDVILIDQVGYLADLYRQADWAFVGGSFKAKVHSVMEPLCCAIPIITGPFIHNSPEALKYSKVQMNNLKVVQSVQSSSDFIAAVTQIKQTSKPEFKKLLIGNVEHNRNATHRIIKFLLEQTLEKQDF